MRKQIICIDPGKTGGWAYYDVDEVVQAEKMPPTMPEIADRLRELAVSHQNIHCVMEKVGFHVQGNAASSSAKFARHCGHLEAILYCMGIPTTQVTPQKWMKKLGALPKEKKDRKNKIKEIAATRFPHLKVTLGTADALGMLITEVDK